MKYALAYHAEGWLYQTNPRAWGYHKALMHEEDVGRAQALAEMVRPEDMAAIKEAYERSSRKARSGEGVLPRTN